MVRVRWTLLLGVFLGVCLGFSIQGEATSESVKKVAIFNPNDVGGSVYGYKGIMGTLRKMKGIVVEYIDSLSLETLQKYDILIFPDCKNVGKQPADWMDCLRTYVKYGGCIVFYHDSVGYVRSPLCQRILFPEVCAGETSLLSTYPEQISIVVANEHFITRDYTREYMIGKRFPLMYYDYVGFEAGPEGKILFTSPDGVPVIVCGEVGKGRVVFNGTVISMKNQEAEEASGTDEDILIKTIEWFSEKSGVDKKAIDKARKEVPPVAKEYRIPDTFVFPTPRRCQIYKTERITLFKNEHPQALIVVGKNAPAKHLLAAREIAEEIRSTFLMSIELPVKKDDQITKRDLAKYNCILIGTPGVNTLLQDALQKKAYTLTESEPGEQGYIIKCFRNSHDKFVVLLAGSDDQGALYAAYSFVQLIKRKEQEIYAVAADIWDRPEFKHRMLGWGGGYPYYFGLEDCKKRIDLFAKMKINLCCYGGAPYPELNEYAKERGIRLGMLYTYNAGLERIINHKCVHENDIDLSGFCWSDERLMKKRLEMVLDRIKKYRPGFYWFHPMDLGYWSRVEKIWPTRCDACKDKFKDPAEADAYMFNTFNEAIKKTDKDILLAFCLPPYQDAPSRNKALYDYLVKLGNLVPKDVMFIIRENSRKEVQAYHEATGHPLMLYQWDGTYDGGTWATLFTAAKDYKGLLDTYWYCVGDQSQELILLGGAEYGWNPDQPVDSYYLMNNFAPRACTFEFGDASQSMKEFYLLDIKHHRINKSWNKNILEREMEKVQKGLALLEKAASLSGVRGKQTIEYCVNFYRQWYLTGQARILLCDPKLTLERAKKLKETGYLQDALLLLKQADDNLNSIDQRIIQEGKMMEFFHQLKTEVEKNAQNWR